MVRVASIGLNRFGDRQPQVNFMFPANTHDRVVRAEIYRLASAIELASHPYEWVVTPNIRKCEIYLELVRATIEEADAGFLILQRLCS